jgi:Protein of unknown function (DUF3172)
MFDRISATTDDSLLPFVIIGDIDPQNVASRDFIDRAAPNPELCVQYGASAMVMDA